MSLCNISKDFLKKTGLNGYVYDFSVGYNTSDISDIWDIQKKITEKNMKWYIWMLEFLLK